MKKVILGLALPLCTFMAVAQNLKLSGTLKMDPPIESVYLAYTNGDKLVKETLPVTDGKFSFEGNITTPVMTSLMLKEKPKEGEKPSPWMTVIEVYLEPGNITIEADGPGNLKITGSKSQDQYNAFLSLLKPYNEKSRGIRASMKEAAQSGDEASYKNSMKELGKVNAEMFDDVYMNYIKKNSASPIAFLVLDKFAGDDFDADKVEAAYNLLSDASKNSASGKRLKARIESVRNLAIGALAKDFTQPDVNGKPVSLSDFKGKYVLLDFWASWCVPCRADNPNLVAAYKQYKDKNFTVLGVSLDDENQKQAWIDAIAKDGLPWTHISDLKAWNSEAVRLYNVKGVPMNFLIDPYGRIVAKDLHGEQLFNKLAEVLK